MNTLGGRLVSGEAGPLLYAHRLTSTRSESARICIGDTAASLLAPRRAITLRTTTPLQYRKSTTRRHAPVVCTVAYPAAEQKTAYANNIVQHNVTQGKNELAYELVQGALVRYCTKSMTGQTPPTAVLVHGILGSRRNLLSFAKRLVQECPSWQVLLVDLRCHGESAGVPRPGPNNVQSAASDLLKLLSQSRLFPDMLVGHSFGGKVVLSMAEQFGNIGKTLPKPVQVWVLDTVPGTVHLGGGLTGANHPSTLIEVLRRFPVPVVDRNALIRYVQDHGFTPDIAQWVATNLQRAGPNQKELVWQFDLNGIAEMYSSYESTSLWHLLHQPPQGLKIDFVKAELSNFLWRQEDVEGITAYGHRVHVLPNSGHWVHSDNPEGLFQLLAPSFGL